MAYAVLTREADGGYAEALAALGLEVVALPVTRTEPAPDPDALVRALAARPDAILVASARAAEALVGLLDDVAALWAVGPATAAALGRPARLGGGDGASTARAILAAHPLPLRVLVPRAEAGRDEAIAILRAGGAEVIDVVAYRTTAIELTGRERGLELLTSGQAAVCIVFAPSQVAALGDVVAMRTHFVAIGPTTAAALREAGVAEVAVAATPTPAGIANAVAAVYPPRR